MLNTSTIQQYKFASKSKLIEPVQFDRKVHARTRVKGGEELVEQEELSSTNLLGQEELFVLQTHQSSEFKEHAHS